MAKKVVKRDDVCPECGGEKKGRGFAHKGNCSMKTGASANKGARMAALESRLSEGDREVAEGLAQEHAADVLRYAATIAKGLPSKVSTDDLFTLAAKAGISSDLQSKLRKLMIAQT